jgi:hypothetical protein
MTEGNYSKVGHRGPVYKGLGAMNPCDLYLLGPMREFCEHGNEHSNSLTVGIACVCYSIFWGEREEHVMGSWEVIQGNSC